MFSFFYEDSSLLYRHVLDPFGFWKRATAEMQCRWQLLPFDETQELHQDHLQKPSSQLSRNPIVVLELNLLVGFSFHNE
jgi:hypothetical protein